MKTTHFYALLLVLTLMAPTATPAQNLSLDPLFGVDGKVEFPAVLDISRILPLPDGKTLVFVKNSIWQHAVIRLNADGSVDSSFGQNGETTLTFRLLEDVILCQNGKILLAGSSTDDVGDGSGHIQTQQFIMRLTANGALDPGFEGTGIKSWDETTQYAGWQFAPFNRQANGQYRLVRYDGDLFTRFELLGFDADGNPLMENTLLQMPPMLLIRRVLAVTQKSNGQYLALLSNEYSTYLAQFNADGAADLNFGDHGAIYLESLEQPAESLLLNESEAYIGTISPDYNSLNVQAISSNDGSPQTGFGVNGQLGFPYVKPSNSYRHQTILHNADGSWIGIQWRPETVNVIRLNSDQSPDLLFAPDGRGSLVINFALQYMPCRAALSASNQILLSGNLSGSTHTLVRLKAATSTATEEQENESAGDIARVWPNPAGNYLSITSSQTIERLEVFAINGDLITSEINPKNQFDLRDFKSGLYIVNIYGKEGNLLQTTRFVKQ